MTRPERASRPRPATTAGLTALFVLSALTLVAVTRPSTAAAMTWSVAASPSAGNRLDSVSCESPQRCVGVGYRVSVGGARRTFAQTTTDTTWTVMPTANRGNRDNVLTDVSCPGSAICVAVGRDDNGAGSETLIETWDGTTWTMTPSPNPGANRSELAAVSCATATTCVAVGSAVTTAGHSQTLVETWDGTTWTTTPSPNPSTTRDAYLNGVSCPTATTCVAVGDADNGVGVKSTLAESWNGTTWLSMPTPNPSPRDNYLRGLSCWKAGKCIAVGWSGAEGSRTALAESLTGTKWTASPTPPAGGAENELLSASCATSTQCVAVGGSVQANSEHTLVLTGSTTPDVTAPSISITSPTDGGYYVVGQDVRAHYTCADEPDGSGIASCVGTAPSGAAIDTASAGAASFSVSATDFADNSVATIAHYRVVEPAGASATAPPGGASITTDPGGGPTSGFPVVTTLTSADAGALRVDQNAVTLTPPAGFDILGIQIETTAPPASSGHPLTVSFDVDGAVPAPGNSVDSYSLLEDARWVPDCPGATTLPVGVSACISGRGYAPSGGGDFRLTALADSAGQWNIATGAAAPPLVNVGNRSVVEGNAGTTLLQVVFSLSQPSALPASASYTSSDLTAHAGSDYTASTGTVAFDPGQTVKVVPVTVNGDVSHENNETFAVTLSAPSGATLGDPDGTETIVDDDPIAPAAPTVQAVSAEGFARVTWALPADNGARITAYHVAVYHAGVLQTSKSHTVTCVQPCTPARTWTVTGFASDVQYTFEVSASNAMGTGPFGRTTIFASSTVNGARLPGRPATPRATAGTGRVTLTWTAALNGTSTITSYALTPYKNGVLQPAIVVGPTVRSFVFTNVTVGAVYTFEVRAAGFGNIGPDSARSNPVRPT